MSYRKNLFNKKSVVLFENKIKDKNKFFGRDEFSNSVIVESSENLVGKIKDVKIISGNQTTLNGKITQGVNDKEFAA